MVYQSLSFQNLDLLSVSITVAATLVLGFSVFFNNTKSITNKTFFWFTFVTALWGVVNYLNYQTQNYVLVLWFIRLVMFFAVWQAYTLFLFLYIFPKEQVSFSFLIKVPLTLIVIFTSLLTLTPFVFSDIKVAPVGQVSQPIPNWGVAVFGVVAVSLILAGIILLLRKVFSSNREERQNLLLILFGISLTFLLIILFNFIAPTVFLTTRFIPLGALFTFPFIAFTSYAILRHKLFNIKVTGTAVLVFLLSIVTFLEVIFANDLFLIFYRSVIFLFVLSFGILLIRGMIKEVEQREKLEQLNRIKSEFLSFASHQVRAPMAVVKGYAELIETQIENVPPQAKDFSHKIRESVNRLLELVEEFMDYRRIEEGKMELHPEEIDLVSLIKEFVNNFNLIAKEKNLELTFETSMEQCLVKVDKMRFSQVIQNLIDNAIKYTNQGWVKVNLQKEDNSILITVADSGIGMSKELQQKLFGEFVRDPSIKREIRGTGLGLYIAKYIVEAHQGKIWAESEGENKGSKFYVKLPLN
jgi:signal transduction histidine kinase